MFTQHYSPVSPCNTWTRLTPHLQKSNTTLSKTGICTASKGLPTCPNSAFIFTPVPPKGYYQHVNSIQASPLNLPQTYIRRPSLQYRDLHPWQEQMLLSAAELPLPVPCPKHHSSESLENETKKDKMQVWVCSPKMPCRSCFLRTWINSLNS